MTELIKGGVLVILADYDGLVTFQMIYIKKIDDDNDGIFGKVKRNGELVEVRIYPPES